MYALVHANTWLKGMTFILSSDKVMDLILNTLALHLILQLDDLAIQTYTELDKSMERRFLMKRTHKQYSDILSQDPLNMHWKKYPSPVLGIRLLNIFHWWIFWSIKHAVIPLSMALTFLHKSYLKKAYPVAGGPFGCLLAVVFLLPSLLVCGWNERRISRENERRIDRE